MSNGLKNILQNCVYAIHGAPSSYRSNEPASMSRGFPRKNWKLYGVASFSMNPASRAASVISN